MKNIIRFFLLIGGISSCISPLFLFARSAENEAAMAKVREIIGSLEGHGAITTDIGEERRYTYNTKIVQNTSSPDIVITEATEWARTNLRETITKKLTLLKQKEYLTEEQYMTYVADYTKLINDEVVNRLGTVYKSYLRFEEEIIAHGVNVVRDAMYKKMVAYIKNLYEEKRITEEKMNSWLVIVERKIYQYQSDPTIVMKEIEDEAVAYKIVLTGSGNETKRDTISDRHYDNIKKTSLVRLQKTSVKNLKNQLDRAKKLLRKYPEESNQAKKQSALIRLIGEVILEKESLKNPLTIKK